MTEFSKRRRRGISLIELLIVMSAFSVLMVINARWLHQSIKFATQIKQQQNQHHNMKRLAWRLRSDVRQSQSIEMSANKDFQLIVNRTPESEIRYTIAGSVLTVEELANATMVKRDEFDLGKQVVARWDTAEMPNWITLIANRRSPSAKLKNHNPTSPVELHVRAGPNPWQSISFTKDQVAE